MRHLVTEWHVDVTNDTCSVNEDGVHDTSTLLTHFGTFEGGEIMVCDGLGCVGGAADITPWSPTTHAKVVDSATNLRLRGGGSTYTRRTQ